MNIVEFITELYCKIDDALPEVAQHSQAILYISELVTIGVLHAIKNVSRRAFYHWLKDNYGHLFPKLPERTRLFRRLEAQACWTGYFLAQPTILGVADSYGIGSLNNGWAIRCVLDGTFTRWARKASPIIAGPASGCGVTLLWAANSALSSTNWARSWPGTAPPPMLTTSVSCPYWLATTTG